MVDVAPIKLILYVNSCPPGFDSLVFLEPAKRCNDQFIIGLNQLDNPDVISSISEDTSNLILRILRSEKDYSGFCLNINDDLTYSARICRKTPSKLNKFE